MFPITFAAAAIAASQIPQRAMTRLRASFHEMTGIWRYALARRELENIDDSTLRDLGISRSELDSYWAETQGKAEPTRRRVLQAMGRGQ
jgi:uncharacterized protein YjiS (DUF1127 family)